MKTKTMDLVIAKIDQLPRETQEQLGREVLVRIKALEELRADLQLGITELDGGRGAPIDIDAVKDEARRDYGEAA